MLYFVASAGALAASVAGGAVSLLVPEVLVPELVPIPLPVVPACGGLVVSDGLVVVVELEVDVSVPGAAASSRRSHAAREAAAKTATVAI
ncbi:hypothetical protein [Piscinibacter sp.]|uniref:hypothetical protein n=1 Tax=Piscinibacter sp. TaxID=1903157 RepID=UPI002BA7408C|nr:hypothetical protein [Albitalea sp.]HUG21258.1 hypothetical protein [Albitalea sp.]